MAVEADSAVGGGRQRPGPAAAGLPASRVLLLVVALLVLQRLAYHLIYLTHDPFALATFSDGQLYEVAARDIIAHPPFGSQPFYLQGLYAYMLALPMLFGGSVLSGLLFQLALSSLALWLFHRAACGELGALAGGLSTIALLAYPELAFFENKYLSVSLGITCNVFALWAGCRALRDPRARWLLFSGFAAGLAVLGRPNMLLSLPAMAAALLIAARARAQRPWPTLALFALGAVLALAPMALRNQIVIGRPEVFPSHGGEIPFYIGNNPYANGRWNTAGGLITGQVGNERAELGRRLGLHGGSPAALDRDIGRALLQRAGAFIREQPRAWLALEAKKLWFTIGNHRFVRDYDVRGESELIGSVHRVGLPFGVLLALGSIGLLSLLHRALRVRAQRARLLGLWLLLAGQLAAVLAANVLVFTSSQNRAPLCVPLAFASGPGLLALWSRLRPAAPGTWQARAGGLLLGAVLFAQAFWPRLPAVGQPSSVHYFNLAAVEESIGRLDAAAAHYGRAVERNPRQPVFRLAHAGALRRIGRTRAAQAELDRLQETPGLPPALRADAERERRLLRATSRAGP